jgi:hypothetical protein
MLLLLDHTRRRNSVQAVVDLKQNEAWILWNCNGKMYLKFFLEAHYSFLIQVDHICSSIQFNWSGIWHIWITHRRGPLSRSQLCLFSCGGFSRSVTTLDLWTFLPKTSVQPSNFVCLSVYRHGLIRKCRIDVSVENVHKYMGSLEQQACTQGWKKAYTVNQIVRMGALNCFEKLKVSKLALQCCNNMIGLSLDAGRTLQSIRLIKSVPWIIF